LAGDRIRLRARHHYARESSEAARSGPFSSLQTLVCFACECPLWVKSGHWSVHQGCPLYPRKRTSCDTAKLRSQTEALGTEPTRDNRNQGSDVSLEDSQRVIDDEVGCPLVKDPRHIAPFNGPSKGLSGKLHLQTQLCLLFGSVLQPCPTPFCRFGASASPSMSAFARCSPR